MAEEKIPTEEVVEETPATESKTPKEEPKPAETAPEGGKPAEAPDEEDISDLLALVNVLDSETGGQGKISDIPKELRNSIKYMYDKLVFMRDLFEDPEWKAILDDLADQKEDGQTPSVEVAVARNIPIQKLQGLAESEDYEAAQNGLADNLQAGKDKEAEEAEFQKKFEASQAAGEEYAKEMGYDEEEKNALFQMVLDLFTVMGDGVLTKEEWAKVDKMRNYDKHTADLQAQIEAQGETKEVLPDQASMEAAPAPKPQAKPRSVPGLGSMSAYQNPTTDITRVGSRRRGGRV